ncbi:tRNA (adenosine(37)-N6)-threonylcarbamoyltransferase complex dimerization subunit type 1 TsaB [Ichthyenterobacterium sp. W332]|uniref:tRNA (Adenosine(37)-N6)-threonylcarbamoyltransferase complex dimerization subunit type 1 TsaB n=1 Tax=Microcosmobacter mediterraneus TaxID=3075607 RepID=A0ABU2YHS9_9FLAO|nr:tRNA (adenosine(37)-N6)-threonylcarbamoyltransferase complex dimerization subunit type 1 TsaB [Ichthyenterobacterium sp. W332]MDT0557701.1 tRNA (adenosine(37)-N6)-threonylcarbamoyltransferase complex dimerization subunit type 1 TsaB [Ichthyenterobacterium sp. W332]
MALILSIETSTTNCSVSLSNEGEILVLKEDYNTQYSHAELLHLFIDDVLKNSGTKGNALDAIAISKGPGSYTGLRIGVSAAKGLCFALDKPLIAVSTLKSLAQQVVTEKGYIVSMLDARRLEVYSAVFDENYNAVRSIQAEVLDKNSFSEFLDKEQVTFIGNGVEKTKSIIKHSNAKFIDGKLPSANEMAALAFNKYKISDMEDVAYFEPYYLKDFVGLKS